MVITRWAKFEGNDCELKILHNEKWLEVNEFMREFVKTTNEDAASYKYVTSDAIFLDIVVPNSRAENSFQHFIAIFHFR